MSIRSGQAITALFTTRSWGTGATKNAAALPSAALYVNGAPNAAVVTVTNIAAGIYSAQVTLPILTVGDVASILVAATVESVSDQAVIWSDSKDVELDGSGRVDVGAVAGQAQTARDLGAQIDAAISSRASATDIASVKSKTDALPTQPAATGDAMTLTTDERAALAARVEAQIIDETDTEHVLQAIVAKIAQANPDLSGLTLASIAAAVRGELATELARLDAAISSRSTYAGADTAGTTTLLARLSEQRAGNLDRLDATVGSRLASADYVAPDNARPANFLELSIADNGQIATDADLNAIAAVRDAVALARGEIADVSDRIGAPATGTISEVVDAVKADTSAIRTGPFADIKFQQWSPVAPDGGIISLIIGDSYTVTDDRPLEWTSDAWPSLVGALVNFSCGAVNLQAQIVEADGTKRVRVNLSSADSRRLPLSPNRFKLTATFNSGDVVTLAMGKYVPLS